MDLCAKNTAPFICKTLIYKQLCHYRKFWNTDKSKGFFCETKQKEACVFISHCSPLPYVIRNPRVHDTRQTENLRENWILRQRNRECNNSPFVISRWFSWGKTGNKKAVWCVQTALKQKKWWRGPGSNRGHKDFQSFALPTELPHHCGCLLFLASCIIYAVFCENANNFLTFFQKNSLFCCF